MKLPKIKLEKEQLENLEFALNKEWIITNGLGGYASSTVLGLNTRKYHGLLVASFNPPVDRHVLLEKLDEEIEFDDKCLSLGSNEFQYGIKPEGYKFLEEFELNPFPTFRFNIEGIKIEKSIFMPQKWNATFILYRVFNPHPFKLTFKIYPLINARHFHSTTEKQKMRWDFVQTAHQQNVMVKMEHPKTFLMIGTSNGKYEAASKWINGIFYRTDASFGESCVDDYYQPGLFKNEVLPKSELKFYVLAVGGQVQEDVEKAFVRMDNKMENAEKMLEMEKERNIKFLENFKSSYKGVILEEWLKWLLLASDSFLVLRKHTNTFSVIAGYHWFEDWGRDSLISLPGLTLVTGRFKIAREILLTFKYYSQNGIIPNRFPDKTGETPVYNTVDATLWYFNSVFQYLKYTNDFDFVRKELWDFLKSVIKHHVKGTEYGIKVDNDFLLAHGPQLTWMDAVVDGKAVTPRSEKAVEIQALWYNALKIMQLLAEFFGEHNKAEEYGEMADNAKESFLRKFWNQKQGYLYDALDTNENPDPSLRPNQIIAVSLDFSMLDEDKAEKIVEVIQKKLLTPYGLRTLSPEDPRYRGKYVGDWNNRNFAYHNGTAWPWLLGQFVTAFLKVKKYEAEWREYAFKNFLERLFTEQVFRAGLGTISEIFDGDFPHEPKGCISQAWSVAEPLRAYVEDVLLYRPQFENEILKQYGNC